MKTDREQKMIAAVRRSAPEYPCAYCGEDSDPSQSWCSACQDWVEQQKSPLELAILGCHDFDDLHDLCLDFQDEIRAAKEKDPYALKAFRRRNTWLMFQLGWLPVAELPCEHCGEPCGYSPDHVPSWDETWTCQPCEYFSSEFAEPIPEIWCTKHGVTGGNGCPMCFCDPKEAEEEHRAEALYALELLNRRGEKGAHGQ